MTKEVIFKETRRKVLENSKTRGIIFSGFEKNQTKAILKCSSKIKMVSIKLQNKDLFLTLFSLSVNINLGSNPFINSPRFAM